MSSLKEIGFTLEKETDKAVLWSCPLGKFWRPKKQFQHHAHAILDNLNTVAREVADEINKAWVLVRIVAQTDGGAARITFPAFRVHGEPDERKTKRVELYVPAGWLLNIGGRWAAPVNKLAEKMDVRRERAHTRAARAGVWRPDSGNVTDAEQILAWLKKVNASILNKRKEDEAVAAAQRQQARLKRFNDEVSQQFEMVLINQYEHAARTFCKSAKGRLVMADLVGGRYHPTLDFIKAAIKQNGFAEWAREWKIKQAEREAARAAKPKPTRMPDRILENMRVEWVDWGGTSKNRLRIENSADSCMVKFFGSKREIALPDGRVIIKMAGPNLKIMAVNS